MPGHLHAHVNSGGHVPGILIVPYPLNIGALIEDLLLIWAQLARRIPEPDSLFAAAYHKTLRSRHRGNQCLNMLGRWPNPPTGPRATTIQPAEANLPAGQAELMAYFEQKIEALPKQKPLQDNDIFLEGLTVAEFFALPEAEQDRLWREMH